MRMFPLTVLWAIQFLFLAPPALSDDKETIKAIFQGHVQRRKQLVGYVFDYECCRKYRPHEYDLYSADIREEFGVWFNETLMIRYCDKNLELPFAFHWQASYKDPREPGGSQEASWADELWGDKRFEVSNWDKESKFWSRPMRGKEPRLSDFLEPHTFLEEFSSKGKFSDDSLTDRYLDGCNFATILFAGPLDDPHGELLAGTENNVSLEGIGEVAGVKCTLLKPTDPMCAGGGGAISVAPDFLGMKTEVFEHGKLHFSIEVKRVNRFEGLLYPVDIRYVEHANTDCEVEIRNVRVRLITDEDLRKWDFPFPAGTRVRKGTSGENIPWPEGFEERVNVAFLQNFRIKQARRNYLAIGGFLALVVVVGAIIYRRRNK
jgi:hypothetical protein